MTLDVYIDFRDPCDLSEAYYPVAGTVHWDSIDRVNVFCSDLLCMCINNCNKCNYLFHVSVYYKLGDHLLDIFPERKSEIISALVTLWASIQHKLKLCK